MKQHTIPLISIVTPSYNQAEFIEETIQSVISQDYPNLEYIIIDGASTDGSVSIIQKYQSQLAYWVSESDQGQTEALIKGFSCAHGEILNWLNSDDLLHPKALWQVAEAFQKSQADLIIGEDYHFSDEESLAGNNTFHFVPQNYQYPDCWRFWDEKFKYHQPCTFFSRRAYEAVGGLNETFHYVMDYDLYCRILTMPNVKVNYLPVTLSHFRLNPKAKTAISKRLFTIEMRQILAQNWASLPLSDQDWVAMSQYLAHCSVHNASYYFKSKDYINFSKTLKEGLSYNPSAFINYAFRSLLN